jgi:hypothetical protein
MSVVLVTNIGFAKVDVRDCAQPERYAPSMVQAGLKNEGLLESEDIDFTKTRVTLLAQEKLKKDLYKQIQKVVFVKKNGSELEAIAENEVSSEECSVGKLKIYLIQKELGPF